MRRLAAALLLLVSMIGHASAAVPLAPELVLGDGGDGAVLIQWRYRGRTQRRSTTLEIERSGNGSSFSPLASVDRPSKRPRRGDGVTDPAPGTGTWWYRGRLVTADGTTSWGEAVSITLGDTSEPPDEDEPDDPEWSLPDGMTDCPAGTIAEVLSLVNAARAKVDARPLKIDPALAEAARYRAAVIAYWQMLSHAGWVDAIRAAGYGGGSLGENIAYGYKTPAKVMKGWMSSQGHRRNIEYAGFDDIGIGCVLDARGIPWWVQSFGG